MSWKRSNTRYYLYRYFWWLKFPLYWWKAWRYDGSKHIPFKPDQMNYVLGWNDDPRIFFSCYYTADFPPNNFIIMTEKNEPIDKLWCAEIPPKRPTRPMSKGMVVYV